MAKKKSQRGPHALNKIAKVMDEFHSGSLHSGSKKGPKVTNPKQAMAIGYSEQRKANKQKK